MGGPGAPVGSSGRTVLSGLGKVSNVSHDLEDRPLGGKARSRSDTIGLEEVSQEPRAAVWSEESAGI